MRNPLFNIQYGLFVITFLLAVSVQVQQRDRLGKLDVVCRNEFHNTLQTGDLLFPE